MQQAKNVRSEGCSSKIEIREYKSGKTGRNNEINTFNLLMLEQNKCMHPVNSVDPLRPFGSNIVRKRIFFSSFLDYIIKMSHKDS